VSGPAAVPPRRTQRERSESTIARLIDATIESISEVGYYRTSLGEICRRSGSSRGGLTRHFATRLDIVAAAAETVAERHLAAVRSRLADRPGATIGEVLRIQRERARDPSNLVWFELMVAARTDEELRAHIAPFVRRYYAAMDELAGELPGLGDLDPAARHAVVTLARNYLDGEAISSSLVPEPATEDRCLDLLEQAAATSLGIT
jgi:AcrR family transcriptional regulator